ncbi:5253_t:CDS:2, partial [Rhizophagus irregularis]
MGQTLKNDLDVTDSFLYKSTYSEYMLIPGQFMHQMASILESWNKLTGLYLAKMLTEKLSDKKINEDKKLTN